MPLNLGPRPQISRIAIPKMTDYGSIARMGKEESELDTLAKVERIKSSRLGQMKSAQDIQFGQNREERANMMMTMKASSAYLDIINKGGTEEMAESAYRQMGGTDTVVRQHRGKETTISFRDPETGKGVTIAGPASEFAEGGAVANWLTMGGDDKFGPEVALTGEAASVLASRGINVKFEDKKQTPEEKMADAIALADYKEGLRAKRPKEPKTPTSAMAAFLSQNPDATPDEIAAFSQKLKTPPAEKDKGLTDVQQRKSDISIAILEDDIRNITQEKLEEGLDPVAKLDLWNESSDKDYYYTYEAPKTKEGMIFDSETEPKIKKITRKKLTEDEVNKFIDEAGGDLNLARKLAKRKGYAV